ncbi:MAG: gliding motility-associated C-terminal domain-containing protein [Bacteroidales bacterium]|nr:gliding motility-associated C-terminal domain-containing protein [Bacteroidales bacterium]
MKYFISILFLIICLSVKSQNLETPKLISVSVDTVTGCPLLNWSVENPQNVDGYVIKRLIFDGVGVMSNTYNNVAVIDNNSTFSWVDNSTEFGTKADPQNRIEFYRVASFVNDGENKKYSLMSDPVSTILLSVEYDRCSNQYSAIWNGIKSDEIETIYFRSGIDGVEDRIAVLGNDTTFTYQFKNHNVIRNFAVEFCLKSGQSFFSSMTKVIANNIQLPEIFNIQSASVNHQKQIELILNISESYDVSKVELVRQKLDEDTSDIQRFELPLSSMSDYHYIDETADPNVRYSYHLEAFGNCGTAIAFSKMINNVVLIVLEGEDNSNALSWNILAVNNLNSINYTNIYRQIDENQFENLGYLNSFYSSYNDLLSNMISDNNNYSGKFCYQVELITIENDNQQSIFSNISCINREPIIYIPNALNPNSTNENNQIFRPKADFLEDYHLIIYNKRGAVVFETKDINEGWNGYDKSGKYYPRDTYFYNITFKTSDNKPQQRSGCVNLVY